MQQSHAQKMKKHNIEEESTEAETGRRFLNVRKLGQIAMSISLTAVPP
jgi:hypothetical protein